MHESLLVSAIANDEFGHSDDNDNDNDNQQYHNTSSEKINSSISPQNKPTLSSNVVIHVCDESRNLEKSFECNRQLLIEKMTYFAQYLSYDDDEEEEEEVDISVHCDILVFEWLIQYISNDTKPELEIHNVVSILISSHFLQMNLLVTQCINFMCKYLNEIVQLPLDLSCLNDEIIKMIATKLNILQIDLLNDPTDKIVSRLYRYHLEIFIKKKEHKLFYCVYCGELYTKEQRKKLICYKSPVYINFHGEISRKHCAQKGWYINKYLLGLRLQNYSWKSIYWHLWSLTRSPLFCYKCDQYITIPNLYHCIHHTKPPINACNKGLNTLFYPCCQFQQNNFEIVQTEKKGCAHKQHQVLKDNVNNNENTENDRECGIQKILNIVSTHSQFVLVPFECSNSCSISTTNKRFVERPQSADHRSRLIKHHGHNNNFHTSRNHHHSSKRFSLNSPPKTTGVWDKKYFVFGSQSSSKALNRNHQNRGNNVLDFDVYHKPITFWYNEDEEDKNKKNNEDITEDSFEYLSYLLTFDNIDYGEGDDDNNNQTKLLSDDNYLEGEDYDDEDIFTDDGSMNMEDVHDVMFFHSENVNKYICLFMFFDSEINTFLFMKFEGIIEHFGWITTG